MSSAPSASTFLNQSAFHVLGVTIRDDRRTIVEQAEERALHVDSERCQAAKSELINPRSRLGAELAWLPGIAPKTAEALVVKVVTSPKAFRTLKGLPSLARANLLAASVEATGDADSSSDMAAAIRALAVAAEAIRPEEVLRDLNEDRAVAGFPEIPSVESVTEELTGRMRALRDVVRQRLDAMEPNRLLDILTEVVETSTSGGEELGPALVHDLVDSFEIEAQRFFDREHATIRSILERIRKNADSGKRVTAPEMATLEGVLHNFGRVANPIQLSKKARGLTHGLSREVAGEVRGLGVDLCNEHDLIDLAGSITDLLKKYFSHVPEIAEKTAEDATAIERLSAQATERRKQGEEWKKNVTFRAQVGAIFKDDLEISPAGIRYRDDSLPLDSVTGVRWGGVRHSINGIPTGTTYQIGISGASGLLIDLRKEATYSGFLKALWPAVCVRLVIQTCGMLERGQTLTFGDMTVEDGAVTLIRHKFLGSERVKLVWHEVHVWSANGSFFIGSRKEKKVHGSASYIHAWNTHILEHIIRGGFEKGIRNLSDYLKG